MTTRAGAGPYTTAASTGTVALTYASTPAGIPNHDGGYFQTAYGTTYTVSNYSANSISRGTFTGTPGTRVIATGLVKPTTSLALAVGGPATIPPANTQFTAGTVPWDSTNALPNMVELLTFGQTNSAYVSVWVWRSGKILMFTNTAYIETTGIVVGASEFVLGVHLTASGPVLFINGVQPAMTNNGWRTLLNVATTAPVVALSTTATDRGIYLGARRAFPGGSSTPFNVGFKNWRVVDTSAITTASAAVPTPDTASVRAKNGAENREIALGLVYNTSNTFNGANATGRTLWRGVIDSTIADMEIVSDTQMRVSSDRDATGQVRLGAGSAIVLAPKIVTPGGDPSTKILVQSEALENLGVTPVTDTRRNHTELPVRNGATTEPHLWKMNASVDTTAPWRTADSVSGLYLTYSNTVQPDHASVPGFFSTKYGTSGYNVSNYRATGFTRPGDIISPGTGMLFTGVVKPVTSFEFATGGPSVNNPGAALSAPFTCTVPGSSNTNVNMVEICTVGDATTAGRYVSAWVWRSGRILVFNGYSYNETVDPVVSDAEFTFGIGLIGTSPTVYVNGQKPAMSGWRSMDTNESTSTNVNVSLSSAATTPGATTTTLTGATSVPLGVNLDGAFTLVINFKTPTGSFDADLTNNPNLNEYVYFYIGDNGSSDNNTSIAMGTRNGGVWFKVANMQTATVADDLVIRSLLRMEPGEDVSVSITRTVDSNGNAIYRWTVNDVAVLGNETYGSSLPLFSYNTGYAGAYHIFGTVTPEYPNGTPLNTPLGGQAPVCETTFDAMGTLTTNSGGILPYLTIANGGLQGGSGDLNIGNEQGLWTMTGGSGNVGSVSAGSLVTFGTFTVTGNQLQANTSSTNADYASIDLSNAGFNGALGTFTISVAYRHPSTAPVDANDASSVLFYGDPSGAYIGLYHDLNGILHIKTSTGDVATNANVMDGVEHSIVLSRLTTADGGAIGTITLPTTWPGEWGFNNTLNNIGTGTSGSFTTSGTTLSTTDLIIPLTTAGAGGSVQAIDLNTQGSTTNDGLGAFMVETRMKTGQINTYDYYHILTVGDNFATGSTGNAIRLVLSGGIFFFMTIWPGSTGTSASQGYYATIATSKLALATGTGDPENMNYHTYRIARKATSTGVASAETIYQFWYDDIEVPWTNANWRFAAPNNVNVTATRSLYNPVLKSPTSNYIRVGRTLFNTTTNTSWMVDYVRFKNDILVPGPIVTPTYNGMYRLYVDGQSITIPTAPPELGNVSIATKTLTMGKYGYPSRDSVWDNIRFLNRALTTSEAQQLGKAVFPQYYRMSNASLPGANANFAISVDYTPPNDAPRPATSCKELYSTTADRSLRANCNRTSG
eukprot:jgi/Mesvir1/8541/Mv03070-RA.1